MILTAEEAREKTKEVQNARNIFGNCVWTLEYIEKAINEGCNSATFILYDCNKDDWESCEKAYNNLGYVVIIKHYRHVHCFKVEW